MIVDSRLYKKFDADLIALFAAGYSVSEMMRIALYAYANEQPINIYIDEIVDLDMNLAKTVHTRVSIPNSDTKSINLIKNTKFRCRNMLLKAILRNALIQQPISCLVSDKTLDRLQTSNLMSKNIQTMANVVPISVFKQENKKQISIEDFFSGNMPAPANATTVFNIPQVVYPAPVQMTQMPIQPMQIPMQTPIPAPIHAAPAPAPVVPETVSTQAVNTTVDAQPIPVPTPIAVNPAPQPTETPKPKEEPVNNIVNESTPVNNESGEQSPEDDDVSVGLAGNDELMKMFDNI